MAMLKDQNVRLAGGSTAVGAAATVAVADTEAMMQAHLEEKMMGLMAYLKGLGRVVVAFSGGVDSTFLAYAAQRALGDGALAITLDSVYIPRWELDEAKQLAREIGIQHHVVGVELPSVIENNPPNRCYLCKKEIFGTILQAASAFGVPTIVDGSNADDLLDYRPGMAALKELNILSPLLELGWTKDEIRMASAQVGLATHDKPAYACLLTRLPYNTPIQKEELTRIERAEVYLMNRGFRGVRVRSHGDVARIEVPARDRSKLFDEALLDEISEVLKGFGILFVAIEASGYRMGSFNTQLQVGDDHAPR